jgi:hypothetical protein
VTQLQRARAEYEKLRRDPFKTPLKDMEDVLEAARDRRTGGTSDGTIEERLWMALRDFSRAVLALQDAKRRLNSVSAARKDGRR